MEDFEDVLSVLSFCHYNSFWSDSHRLEKCTDVCNTALFERSFWVWALCQWSHLVISRVRGWARAFRKKQLMKISWHSLVPLNLLIGEQKSFQKFLRDVLGNESPFSSGNFINYCTFFPHSQFFFYESLISRPQCPNFEEWQAGSLNTLGIMSGYSWDRTKPSFNIVLVSLAAHKKVFWPAIIHILNYYY